MISVIIPYFNKNADKFIETLLFRSIKSAIQELEGNFNFQIIVIDDGSPKTPEQIIERVNNPNVILSCEKHKRLGAARNKGLDMAKGDIITFLDADDFYFKGTLAPCIKAMKESGADLLMFAMVKCRNLKKHSIKQKPPSFQAPQTGREYMKNNNLRGSSCSFLFKKKLITNYNLRFLENIFIEDEEFTPRLFYYSEKMVITNYKVYAYYQRKDSIINKKSIFELDKRSAYTLIAIKSLMEFMEKVSEPSGGGIERRITFLAVDHIRRSLQRQDWKNSLSLELSNLNELGLYPLPNISYSRRYYLFRLLSKNMAGLRILRLFEKITCK